MATVGFRGAPRRSTAGLAILAMVGGAVAGCDSPVDVDLDTYALASVNGEALPAPYPDPFLYPQGKEPVEKGSRRGLRKRLEDPVRHRRRHVALVPGRMSRDGVGRVIWLRPRPAAVELAAA